MSVGVVGFLEDSLVPTRHHEISAPTLGQAMQILTPLSNNDVKAFYFPSLRALHS